MYRKFYLENGNSETYNLTERDVKCFLSSPSGLGFNKQLDSYTLGNIKKVSSASYDFSQITGDMLFYDKLEKAYQDYYDFVKFTSIKPLRFYYLPPNTLTPFYCDVELTQLSKSEYDGGYLKVPFTFSMISRWLTTDETIIVLENKVKGTGKHYDLERPYYYPSSPFNDVTINNKGSESTGLLIEIDGTVKNPKWSIYQNGKVYGTCKIDGTYSYVRVDSRDGRQSIYLEKDGVAVTNPTIYQDLSITDGGVLTFIKAKSGISIFSFICDGIDTFDGTVRISFSDSYISV